MVNKREFKGELYRNGYTMKSLSLKMGISKTALYAKLNNKIKFNIDDIEKIITILNLNSDQTNKIFFNKDVT